MNKCFKFLIGLFMITLFTGCSLNNAEKEAKHYRNYVWEKMTK